MGVESLAVRLGVTKRKAAQILRAHQERYRVFWAWADRVVKHAMLGGSLETALGWPVHVGRDTKSRSLRNFIMQGDGAEMMRLAVCMGVEAGLEICWPIHDALLLCAPEERLEADAKRLGEIMIEAGKIVLDGFEVRVGGLDKPIIYPNHYMDDRGQAMWDTVWELVKEIERGRNWYDDA